jgi:hypothetical protein
MYVYVNDLEDKMSMFLAAGGVRVTNNTSERDKAKGGYDEGVWEREIADCWWRGVKEK